MKEEGDSLHVKKAYDKFVANSDKVHKSECLGILRNANHINRGVIDQYRLLHESLYTIQAKKKKPRCRCFKNATRIHWQRYHLLSGVKGLAHFYRLSRPSNAKHSSMSIQFFRSFGMTPIQRTRNLLLKLLEVMEDSLYSVASIFLSVAVLIFRSE